MSTEQNKALLRRLFDEGMNKNNVRVFEELLAPNYVNYSFPGLPSGPKGFEQAVGMFRAAFPDMRLTVEDQFAEGDKVGTRGYFTGTHKGEFQGIPPTGKPVKFSYIDVWRVANGKFVENWVQMDMMGLMQQLGVVPTPE